MRRSCWKTVQHVKKNVQGCEVSKFYDFMASITLSADRFTGIDRQLHMVQKISTQTNRFIHWNNEDRSDRIISFETNKLIIMNDMFIELVTTDVLPLYLSRSLAHCLSFYWYVWCATNSFHDFLLHFRTPKQINRKKYYISAFNWWQCIPVCVYQNPS